MDQTKTQVVQIIDSMRDDIVTTISEVVRIPSVNPGYPGVNVEEVLGGESAANEYLAEICRRLGAEVELVEAVPRRANLVGRFRGTGDGRSLIFCGHIDTVPTGEPELWTGKDPFSGRVANGRIYGRGSVDMKGGLVAQLKAMEALQKAGVRLKGDLLYESVCGEEVMDHKAGVTAVVERGFGADAAIVSEASAPPYPLAVVPANSGLFWMRVSVQGKATHSAVRDELFRAGGRGADIGADAIEKGVYIYKALQQLEHEWGLSKTHPLHQPGHFMLHCGVFSGNPHGVKIPFLVADECSIDYSVWYPPNQAGGDVKREIEEYLAAASRLDPWLKEHPPKVEWLLDWPAPDLPVDHPICQAVAGAHEQVTGAQARFHGFCAAADSTFLNMAGIPAIIYGPGDILVAHSIDEYVPIDEVITATKTYAFVAMDWCGVAD